MNIAQIAIFTVALWTPLSAFAQESLITNRLEMSFEEGGNWQLTDIQAQITWRGQWISDRLMKVEGTDNSCFIVSEEQGDMIQTDCKDVTKISMLISGAS